MQAADAHYPAEACPFCAIAAAYPHPGAPGEPQLWRRESAAESLAYAVPGEEECGGGKTSPESFVVVRSRDVVAFLDVMPMTGGHLLVATRSHVVKIADMATQESREMGFWLPLLARTVAKATGVADYNIVQNNGARAAQVVPHVHFHIIPRPESLPRVPGKSWAMFGRGLRDDLDEEEGGRVAREMRRVLRAEVEGLGREGVGAKL
ncbi:HIT-like protein [Lizonia empirigonia]|nr:HIT-like protein [Lizonia empirigonia]